MLNWQGIKDKFPYPLEIPTIFAVVQAEEQGKKDFIKLYPFLVDPYAFMLSIRKQEAGRKGREFGVLHPQAINTNLVIQAEWCIATILNDTRRWHLDVLICVGGRKRKDFVDWVSYFSEKYCPIGVKNDPTGLNKFWLPGVRANYKDFTIKE